MENTKFEEAVLEVLRNDGSLGEVKEEVEEEILRHLSIQLDQGKIDDPLLEALLWKVCACEALIEMGLD